MAADLTVPDIASIAHVDPSTVYRFERARAWPRDPDALIAAYANQRGEDPADLWQQAIDRWRATR